MHWRPIRGGASTDLGVRNFCSGEITFTLGTLSREGKVARHRWEGGRPPSKRVGLGKTLEVRAAQGLVLPQVLHCCREDTEQGRVHKGWAGTVKEAKSRRKDFAYCLKAVKREAAFLNNQDTVWSNSHFEHWGSCLQNVLERGLEV